MAKVYDTEQVGVEQIEAGNTLAIPDEGGLPPRFYRIKTKRVERQSEESVLVVLESDPLPGESRPWVLTYQADAVVARIVGYHEQ